MVLYIKTEVPSEEESWSKYQTNIDHKGSFKGVGAGGRYLLLAWLWCIVLNTLFWNVLGWGETMKVLPKLFKDPLSIEEIDSVCIRKFHVTTESSGVCQVWLQRQPDCY